MKRVLVTAVCLLALMFAAIPAGAQTRSRCTNRSYTGRYDGRTATYNRGDRTSSYNNSGYYDPRYSDRYSYDPRYGYYDNRSRWERSRDKITTAAGAGAGAVIGGLISGKRGAIVGAIAGGGGAALYTYKLRDRRRSY